MNEKIENIEIRSEEISDILTKMPHGIIRWGNLLFFVLLVLVLLISWFVKYPDIITAQALITTSTPPQKEYAKVSGKLEHLLVENNQTVTQNQILGVVENAANYTDVLLLKKMIDTSTVDYQHFYFPIDSLPNLFLGDLESDFALFQNAYLQYQLNAKLQPFAHEIVSNRYNINELQNQLSNLQNQINLNAKELQLNKNELNRQKSLYEKGVISAQDFENKELEYYQSERSYKSMLSNVSQIKNAISAAKSTSQGTAITKTKEDIHLLKNVIQSFNQLKKRLKDWELHYLFKSNIKGKVTFFKVWNKNQALQTGELVFTIVPTQNSNFIARLKTPILNIGKVKIGQTVNIKLNNYPETEFGMLKGKVKSVSLTPDTDGFYWVEVVLPSKLITTYNKEIPFQQETTATADIITEDLRLIQRFFYQFLGKVKR